MTHHKIWIYFRFKKFSFTIQDLMLLTISLDLLKLYLYYTPICVQLKHLISTYLRTIIIWVPTYIYFLRKPLVNLTWPKITRTILEFQKVLQSRKTLRKFSIWEIVGSLVVSLKLLLAKQILSLCLLEWNHSFCDSR